MTKAGELSEQRYPDLCPGNESHWRSQSHKVNYLSLVSLFPNLCVFNLCFATYLFIPVPDNGCHNSSPWCGYYNFDDRPVGTANPLTSAEVGWPLIISETTLPVPRDKDIPQGPCPAAIYTPPLEDATTPPPKEALLILPIVGTSLLPTGRKQSPSRTISKSSVLTT